MKQSVHVFVNVSFNFALYADNEQYFNWILYFTGCAVSGLVADSRTLVDHARVECANHWFVYNEDMKVESVAQAVSNLAIRFGDSDDDGPAMVMILNFDGYVFINSLPSFWC